MSNKTLREKHEAGFKPVPVLIKDNATDEVFDDEFWPETTLLEEVLEIFDEEYGNEKYTLLNIKR
jgi:nitrogen regulatory protein PII-like uncharacterized protein